MLSQVTRLHSFSWLSNIPTLLLPNKCVSLAAVTSSHSLSGPQNHTHFFFPHISCRSPSAWLLWLGPMTPHPGALSVGAAPGSAHFSDALLKQVQWWKLSLTFCWDVEYLITFIHNPWAKLCYTVKPKVNGVRMHIFLTRKEGVNKCRLLCYYTMLCLPGGSDGKASACNVGDLSSIPGSGRSPGEGNSNPLSTLVWRIP